MNLKLLKQKDFALLIIGKLVSLLGSNIQQFALSLYVLALTGSTTIFASILAISIIPRLLLSPVAGVFGDWFNRKYLIVMLDLVNAFVLFGFALHLFTAGELSLPLIYLLVIALEITEIFFQSAMAAVIPSIVEKDDLLEANSMQSLVLSIGQLFAPVIAAFVYGVFGLLMVITVNAISFLLSAISEMFINIPNHVKKTEKKNVKLFILDLKEGIKVIKENRFISSIIGLATIINFCIGPLFSIGLIFIIKEVLVATDFQFGIFQMVLTASMIAAPLFCTKYIKRVPIGKLSFISFMSISILILMISIVPSNLLLGIFIPNIFPYILLLLLSFIIGIFVSIANISIGTLFNQVVPLEVMGRAATVLNLSVTIFIPVGQMLFGYLYDILLPSYVIMICGSILLLTVLRYRKTLIRLDEPEEETEEVIEETTQDELLEGGIMISEV